MGADPRRNLRLGRLLPRGRLNDGAERARPAGRPTGGRSHPLTASWGTPIIRAMLDWLRIISTWACILAGVVYGGLASLLMSVVSFGHPLSPLIAVIAFSPAAFFCALAFWASKSEADQPF